MKVADSGMPEEQYWNSLFDVPTIVEWLRIPHVPAHIVEIGCGYGTFTVPVAKATTKSVWAFDIDKTMIDIAEHNARSPKCENIVFVHRDVLESGTGLPASSAGLVLLFNILHFKEHRLFLQEASRILVEGGDVAIIHWRIDIVTPRGPKVELRPDRDKIMRSVAGLGLLDTGEERILEPYHWGIKFKKGKGK